MSIRRQWCAALAKLVSPSFPDDATAALVDMLPALKHLPDHLFCEGTLIEVAGAKRRQAVPAFDEIVAAMNQFRRTYLPDPNIRRLSAPAPAEAPQITQAERDLIADQFRANWARMRAEVATADPKPERQPLRDVTAKGEQLRAIREARSA